MTTWCEPLTDTQIASLGGVNVADIVTQMGM